MSDEHAGYDENEGYELVMPFVVIASKGGPYDDAAFGNAWQRPIAPVL